MPRKQRILVAPEVGDWETFGSLVARLAHYLGGLDVHVTVPCAPWLVRSNPLRQLSDLDLPPGFAPHVKALLPDLAGRLDVIGVADTRPPKVPPADLALVWSSPALSSERWQPVLRRFRPQQTLFNVDWLATRTDGIWLAEAALLVERETRRFDKTELDSFRSRTARLVDSDRVTLVATGPSARRVLNLDLDGAARIVCNTAILDEELMTHVRPDIVTFADPIFHFGPSTYAHLFRRSLVRQTARYDFTIVTVERYAALLRRMAPELSDRVIGVRLGTPSWPQNYDLLRTLAVRPYPNILTMLMLPLAATFSRKLEMVGFDGRDPKDSYFWRHGTTVQLGPELEEIKCVHPGFFALDYGDYYTEHVRSLELCLQDIEARGGSIEPRAASHMLPLRRRRPASVPRADRRLACSTPLIVSITPDWTGAWGHFGPWERALGHAAKSAGYRYASLGSKALEDGDDATIPVFTNGGVGRECAAPDRFEAELRRGLAEAAGDEPCLACFYVADVWQLPPLLRVAAERPASTFAVNLMRAHTAITAGATSGSVAFKLLEQCLAVAAGTNVHICLDSKAIVDDLASASGHRTLVWPMIMVADPELLARVGDVGAAPPVHLVAPVTASYDRGFPEIHRLIQLLQPRLASGDLRFTGRYPQSTHSLYVSLARQIEEAGGELVRHSLSDVDFVRLVGTAHVVLLPYTLSTFRTHTSAVLLDAIGAGKPVVAVRGSWAGELVEEFGLGATYEEGEVGSMRNAVERVTDDLAAATAAVRRQRSTVIARYRPGRLVEFLVNLGMLGRPAPDSVALAALKATSEIAVAATFTAEAQRSDDRFDQLVVLDDATRATLDLADAMPPRPTRV